MTPYQPTEYRADCSLRHIETIRDLLLRHAIRTKFANLADLIFSQSRCWIRFARRAAFWLWSVMQSLRIETRSISISRRAPSLACTVCCVAFVRVWEQMRAIAAWPIVARVAGHQRRWVFAARQKQRYSIRIEASPFTANLDVEATVSHVEALAGPRPTRVSPARLIDHRPEALDIGLRKLRKWSSLIVSHVASRKAIRLEPSRMFTHPFGSFNVITPGGC